MTFRARNSARIRELILTMFLMKIRNENQLLSSKCTVNIQVFVKFDSHKLMGISSPDLHMEIRSNHGSKVQLS